MGFKVIVIRPSKPIVDTEKVYAELHKAVKDSVQDGVTFMRWYPPRMHLTRASVYGTAFVSDRQRRWFFAALARGELEVPGKRTMNLARSWFDGSATITEPNRLIGQIASSGATAPYNVYVQSEERQSMFMQALGWRTEADMMARIEPIFRSRLEAVFEDLGK